MDGLSNVEIAQTMNLSVNTIKTHRRKIMQKLEASNLLQLINKIGS